MKHQANRVFPIKKEQHGMNFLVKGDKHLAVSTFALAGKVRKSNASELAAIAEADVTLATRLIERELNLPERPEKEFTSYPVFRSYVSEFMNNNDKNRLEKIHEYLLHPFSDGFVSDFAKNILPHLSVLRNAIKSYDDAMRLDPQTSGIHLSARNKAAQFYVDNCLLMSTVLCDFLKDDRKGNALELIQSALLLNPQTPSLLWSLAITSMKGKFSESDALRASDALAQFASLPASTSGMVVGHSMAGLWIMSGDLLCLCNKTDLARQRYEKALALEPNSTGAQVGFALCDVAENNLAVAKTRLEALLDSGSTSCSANIVLAKIAKLEGRSDDAIAYARKAIKCAKLFEYYREAHILLGTWLFEKNDGSSMSCFLVAHGYPRSDNLPRLGASTEYIGALAILGDRFEGAIKEATRSVFNLKEHAPESAG